MKTMRTIVAVAAMAMAPVMGNAAPDCCGAGGHHGAGGPHGGRCGMKCCEDGGRCCGTGAQQGMGGGRATAREYDPASVTTLKGSVAAVSTTSGGLHVSLRSEGREMDVRLGPAWFAEDEGLEIKAGDPMEVTGSVVGESLIAREVKVGTRTVALRDEQGAPAWSRGARR